MEKAEFVLSADDASRRLDRVIRKFLTALPLSRIYAAIRKGNVRVNGRRVSSDYKTAIGDVLTIDRQLLDCSHLSGRNSATDIHNIQAVVVLDRFQSFLNEEILSIFLGHIDLWGASLIIIGNRRFANYQ